MVRGSDLRMEAYLYLRTSQPHGHRDKFKEVLVVFYYTDTCLDTCLVVVDRQNVALQQGSGQADGVSCQRVVSTDAHDAPVSHDQVLLR